MWARRVENRPEPDAKQRAALEYLAKTPVFRGQWCGGQGLRSNLPSFAFGSREAAETYATDPNDRTLAEGQTPEPVLFEAKLNVSQIYCKTSLKNCDPFFDLDVLGAEFGREVIEAICEAKGGAAENTQGYMDLEEETGRTLTEMVAAWPEDQDRLPPIDAYLALDVPELAQAMQAAGYDGVGFGGTGTTTMEMEWHIFDPDLAISVETGEPIGVWQPTEDDQPEP
jgi:hypothetical protein